MFDQCQRRERTDMEDCVELGRSDLVPHVATHHHVHSTLHFSASYVDANGSPVQRTFQLSEELHEHSGHAGIRLIGVTHMGASQKRQEQQQTTT
jgi:hypothetical protein